VAVFVDEAAEYVDSFDMVDVVDAGGCRFRQRDGYVEVDAAVRAGGVVVSDVAGQDVFELVAVPDQDPSAPRPLSCRSQDGDIPATHGAAQRGLGMGPDPTAPR
jgi:hypothetical protein